MTKKLSQLIDNLSVASVQQHPYVKDIRDLPLLIKTLKELNNIIGQRKIKTSVAKQVTYLIAKKQDVPINQEQENMLNTIIYGPPGVGKTMIGCKLAKIFYALGYLHGEKSDKLNKANKTVDDKIKEFDQLFNFNRNNETLDLVYTFSMVLSMFIIVITSLYSGYKTIGLYGITTLIISFFIISLILCWPTIKKIIQKNNQKQLLNADNNIEENENNIKKPEENLESQLIKIVSREDFIDKYLGGTDKKTKKLLEDNLGKVLFIDEAYSLISGSVDAYGREAVNTLNRFLSEHPNEIIVIFAGYKDLMQNNLFSVQPGFVRRCMWHFDCEGYTINELYAIFNYQLRAQNWTTEEPDRIKKMFHDNNDVFHAYAGDTKRLIYFAQLEYSNALINVKNKSLGKKILTTRQMIRAFRALRDNNINKKHDNDASQEFSNDELMEFLHNLKSSGFVPPKVSPKY